MEAQAGVSTDTADVAASAPYGHRPPDPPGRLEVLRAYGYRSAEEAVAEAKEAFRVRRGLAEEPSPAELCESFAGIAEDYEDENQHAEEKYWAEFSALVNEVHGETSF